jgi:hypothetical protein
MTNNLKEYPEPTPMPVDSYAWKNELNLSNFVNAFSQFRDISSIKNIKSILIIGPGQGLETEILRWKHYKVTTLDIDAIFEPDIVASCHDLSIFQDGEFDLVIASHVVEHLPIRYLDQSLDEIARVGKFALIYVPIAGRKIHFRFKPGFLNIDYSIIIDLFSFWKRPNELKPEYCNGQHYWELGLYGFRKSQFTKRLTRQFEVIRAYRNVEWIPSYNFVLKSKKN